MQELLEKKEKSKKNDNSASQAESNGSSHETQESKNFSQLQLKADQQDSVQQNNKLQKKANINNTGLPDNLKNGVEHLSGHSLDNINVHYNSDKPSQLKAHAIAGGNDIHLASGQEKHLAHEAWHVVQQKEGRVKPTKEIEGVSINDNKNLESEADQMGSKAQKLGEKLEMNHTSELQEQEPSKSEFVSQAVAFQQETEEVAAVEEEIDTSTPEAEEEETTSDSEKEPITKEGEIMSTGITYVATLDQEKETGKVEFTGPNEIFKGSASISKTGDEGYEVDSNASVTGSTPKFSGEMPLMRVPLGVPGVFAAIDLNYGASASVTGELGFKFNLDSTGGSPSDFEVHTSKISAEANASIGVFGGVAAGVPGVGEVKVGGQGTATAKLAAELDVDSSLNMSGKIEGEAIGKLEAVASASLFWYTKSKSIPIVEGTLGKFEKELGPVSLSEKGLETMTNIRSYSFTRNKGDEGSAASKAEDNTEKDPKKLEKKA